MPETAEKTIKKTMPASRTRSIAFCGLTVALMAVSAWVTVPLGPVPFTLQTFVMVFALVALSPRECIVSLVAYLSLGAVGLPVFSSMRGGIGVLMGPTGGFLWGYLAGAALALTAMWLIADRTNARMGKAASSDAKAAGETNRAQGRLARWFAGASRQQVVSYMAGTAVFLAVMYLCGWFQFMQVSGTDPLAAFVVAVAPFVVIDLIKALVALVAATAVKRALR